VFDGKLRKELIGIMLHRWVLFKKNLNRKRIFRQSGEWVLVFHSPGDIKT